MRCPSDAQAALLALIAQHDERGENVEWQTNARDSHWASLQVERIDREANTSRFLPAYNGQTYRYRIASVKACVRYGWLVTLHKRTFSWPATEWRKAHEWHLHQLDTTEDGVIALGLWRERKLNAPPAPTPTMTPREREIADLAQRAYDLGYTLAAREPARAEANRMRKAGWFTDCWIANAARGLVPTPMAVVEIRPERADQAPNAEPSLEGK